MVLEVRCLPEYKLSLKIFNALDKTVELVNEFESTPQNILAAQAFAKINISFKSVFELCNNSLPHDAMTVCRSIFETLCILKATCNESDFAEKYEMSYRHSTKKLLESTLKYPNDFSTEMRNFATEEVLNTVNNFIKTEKIRNYNVSEIASIAGLQHMYLTFYKIASEYAHGSILNMQYITHEDGYQFIDYKPSELLFKEVLLNGVYFSLIAIESYTAFMKVHLDDLNIMVQEMDDLFSRLTNTN